MNAKNIILPIVKKPLHHLKNESLKTMERYATLLQSIKRLVGISSTQGSEKRGKKE